MSQPDIKVHSGLEWASLYYYFLSTVPSPNLMLGRTVKLPFSPLLVLHLQLGTIATTSVTCTFRICLNPDNYSQKTFTLAGLLSLFLQKNKDLCVSFLHLLLSLLTPPPPTSKPCERQPSISPFLPVMVTLLPPSLNPSADTFDCL